MVTNAVKHVIVMEHHVMLLLEHVTAQPEKCCPSVLKVAHWVATEKNVKSHVLVKTVDHVTL